MRGRQSDTSWTKKRFITRWVVRSRSSGRDFSEQIDKLIFRQAGFTNQRPQCSLGQGPVIGHSETAHLKVAQNDVAAGLVVHLVAQLLKSAKASWPEQTVRRLMLESLRFPR